MLTQGRPGAPLTAVGIPPGAEEVAFTVVVPAVLFADIVAGTAAVVIAVRIALHAKEVALAVTIPVVVSADIAAIAAIAAITIVAIVAVIAGGLIVDRF